MKKGIKLRGELVFMMVVSLLLSFAIVIGIRNHGIGFRENSKETRVKNVRKEYIEPVKKTLEKCNLNDTAQVEKLCYQKYQFQVGYDFYLVDKDGKVITGTSSGVTQINRNEIVDGKLKYQASTVDKNVFRISGCEYLKNQYYLYYTYLRYDVDDTGMILIGLLGALLFFFCLIWGRISYISTIRGAVSEITKGNLGQRVPLRYQNELNGLAVDINQMATSLENEEKKKNEFLTNISHDIRTPLTTLLGYLDMIQKKKYDSAEQKQAYLDIMERKGNFLASMLEDFFQFSKLESGDITLNKVSFELNELLRQFYEDEEVEFAQKSLQLKIDLYPEPLPYFGDPELFARVVNNLLSNALKYSKINSTVVLKSGVEKRDREEYIVFSVCNVPKQEITEENLNLMFDRLYKRDPARKEEGSGLGLAIVKNIIQLHNGQTEVYREEDRLVFQVLLRKR